MVDLDVVEGHRGIRRVGSPRLDEVSNGDQLCSELTAGEGRILEESKHGVSLRADAGLAVGVAETHPRARPALFCEVAECRRASAHVVAMGSSEPASRTW